MANEPVVTFDLHPSTERLLVLRDHITQLVAQTPFGTRTRVNSAEFEQLRDELEAALEGALVGERVAA